MKNTRYYIVPTFKKVIFVTDIRLQHQNDYNAFLTKKQKYMFRMYIDNIYKKEY